MLSVVRSHSGRNEARKIYFRSGSAFYYIRSDPLYRFSRRRSSPVARSASGSPAGAAVCVIACDGVGVTYNIRWRPHPSTHNFRARPTRMLAPTSQHANSIERLLMMRVS